MLIYVAIFFSNRQFSTLFSSESKSENIALSDKIKWPESSNKIPNLVSSDFHAR